ncbi:protein neuralized-like [Paramacrobiotus metropolitanus]|uniref:protein neuralized-like n=1 Tax=Paramacrobiotus metropolitanus TaxID=2943436 RepID=UPI00244598DD|nr:protein neuralized-like [Paramacrobiotus metropolitanus]XP_055344083.1 protein neuralized-like [Paramacrobiotus metropolitanus]XP_055344084.1 protein neuralized-like [Paramacrobiotus metropolitanus]XP_055344086.1 protein neuralized-like [Paramacrobiotus metropolitanus]XP_055344087.1 protein neuralized-like [Paramacrobiotus metropolitanus]
MGNRSSNGLGLLSQSSDLSMLPSNEPKSGRATAGMKSPKSASSSSSDPSLAKSFSLGHGDRPSSVGTLRFHSNHGEHVQISPDGSAARRVRSYCKGIVFSNRPIEKGECVCFRISEQLALPVPPASARCGGDASKVAQWSGSLRIGLTTHDPQGVDLAQALYLCPDLTSRPGFWGRPLPEVCRPAPGDTSERIIHFQCLPDGATIVYGVNGVNKGTAFENVDTSVPLWAVFDVYGTTVALQLLDSSSINRPPNQTRSHSSISPLSVLMAIRNRQNSLTSSHPPPVPEPLPPPPPPVRAAPPPPNSTPAAVAAAVSRMAISSTTPPVSSSSEASASSAPVSARHRARHFPHLQLKSLKFFRNLTGRNVLLSEEGRCVKLVAGEFCNGYVFTPRPIAVNETVVVRIIENDWDFDGGLAFGLTTCDPAALCQANLPDDADNLLDRPEYWVVAKDVASKPKEGQEYAFTIRRDGTVQISRNNNKPSDFLFVDNSQTFWMFFDLYGTTRKILLLGSCPNVPEPSSRPSPAPTPTTTPRPPQPTTVALPRTVSSAGSSVPRPRTSPVRRQTSATYPTQPHRDLIDLTVDLPSPRSPSKPSTSQEPAQYGLLRGAVGTPSQPVAFPPIPGTKSTAPPSAAVVSECIVCFEDAALAVLYTCGHQVMCYPCATTQLQKGKSCPICRTPIKDIIRTYRG